MVIPVLYYKRNNYTPIHIVFVYRHESLKHKQINRCTNIYQCLMMRHSLCSFIKFRIWLFNLCVHAVFIFMCVRVYVRMYVCCRSITLTYSHDDYVQYLFLFLSLCAKTSPSLFTQSNSLFYPYASRGRWSGLMIIYAALMVYHYFTIITLVFNIF